MITLYTWTTPNGRKISIMLEELGLPYDVRAVNITNNEQFAPDFLAISPNNKIPAIVDDEPKGGGAPLAIFESAAILIYLAEKSGKFLAPSGAARVKALEWLSWQVGGLGPMMGQLGHFGVFAKDKIPYAIERYKAECERLFAVLEKRLSESEYLAGKDYSIADIACYPWMLKVSSMFKEHLSLTEKPAIGRWLEAIGNRPAVARGMVIPPDAKP